MCFEKTVDLRILDIYMRDLEEDTEQGGIVNFPSLNL